MKIYIASSYGFSEAGRHFYYGKLIPILKNLGFEVLDPWDTDLKDPSEIGKRNEGLIKQCDILLACIDGVDIDSGVAAEIGFARALDKYILAYRGDFRKASDNDQGEINLQVEYFIKEKGIIVYNLNSLEYMLKEIKKSTDYGKLNNFKSLR